MTFLCAVLVSNKSKNSWSTILSLQTLLFCFKDFTLPTLTIRHIILSLKLAFRRNPNTLKTKNRIQSLPSRTNNDHGAIKKTLYANAKGPEIPQKPNSRGHKPKVPEERLPTICYQYIQNIFILHTSISS